DVDEEAADELASLEGHGGVAAWSLDPVVLDLEGDAPLVGGDQAAAGDGDAVGVARQVGEHRLGAGERSLGIDEPARPLERRQEGSEGLLVGKMRLLAEERELAGLVGCGEL